MHEMCRKEGVLMPVNVNEIEPDEKIVEIEMERLREFQNHPFKVKADAQMLQLIESISKYGILNPLIVRPLPEGVYEIIAGHRRKYAAQHLGFRKMPVIIRVLRDDDAVINMVDSNLFRETIRPSEKAFAYKMKYEAIKRKSGRKNGGQIDYHLLGKRTIEIIGEDSGESAKQVQRFMKLTELIPELQEMLDEGAIAFNPAYEAAFLTEEEQKNLIKAMEYTQSMPSLSQAQRLKRLSKEKKLTLGKMKEILAEVKKGEIHRVMFKNEQLYQYFPRNYTPEQMKNKILEVLEAWQADTSDNKEEK